MKAPLLENTIREKCWAQNFMQEYAKHYGLLQQIGSKWNFY